MFFFLYVVIFNCMQYGHSVLHYIMLSVYGYPFHISSRRKDSSNPQQSDWATGRLVAKSTNMLYIFFILKRSTSDHQSKNKSTNIINPLDDP